MNIPAINNIFSVTGASFEQRCLAYFVWHFHENMVYREWCQALGRRPGNVRSLQEIPFLPVSFFKTDPVVTGQFEAERVFESSGTTGQINSKHYLRDVALYRQSFMQAFRMFYGDPADYCILALLPSYLERGGSSLVFMVDKLIAASGHDASGFYLYDHEKLAATLQQLERSGQRTILFGVTYALLDFAAAYPMQLQHTAVIETGGMKGRREEMTRAAVHDALQQQFQLPAVHSEYGMTELLSQAYSKAAGIFHCPPWMKIVLRSEDDPLELHTAGRGVINVIDLANVYSCAFIATDDAGLLHADGSFEVLGRVDNSDIRGCSLMVV